MLSETRFRNSGFFFIYLFILFWTINASDANFYRMRSVYIAGSGERECINQLEKVVSDWSGYIYSHNTYPAPYSTDRNCFLLLMAEPHYRIRLTVIDFNIKQSTDCKEESLAIFDQDGVIKSVHDSPGPIQGQYCGHRANGSTLAESRFNALTLWWHTGGQPSHGFKIIWTLFRDQPIKGCNRTSELECDNGECIPVQLACDSVPHCTDSTDLRPDIQRRFACQNIAEGGELSKGALAGICVSVVVGSVLLCVLASVCCRDLCCSGQSASHMSTVSGTDYSSPSPQPMINCRQTPKPPYSRTPIYAGGDPRLIIENQYQPYANGRTNHLV